MRSSGVGGEHNCHNGHNNMHANGIPVSVNGGGNHAGGGHFTADLSGKIARRGPAAAKGGNNGGGGRGGGGNALDGGGPDTPRRHGGSWLARAARRRWPLALLAALAIAAGVAGFARLELLQKPRAAVPAAAPAVVVGEQQPQQPQQAPSLLKEEQVQQHVQEQQQPKAAAAAPLTGVATTETTTQRTGLPAPADPRRLLLATHNRLLWYYPLNDTYHVSWSPLRFR